MLVSLVQRLFSSELFLKNRSLNKNLRGVNTIRFYKPSVHVNKPLPTYKPSVWLRSPSNHSILSNRRFFSVSTTESTTQTFDINETTTNEVLFSVVQDICKEGLQSVIDANSHDLVVLIRTCQILASRNITYAQLLLGLIYSKEGPHKNDNEALRWFKAAASPKENMYDEEESILLDKENLKIAQYAVGVSLITGNPESAFISDKFSSSPKPAQDYLEVDNPKFYLGDGFVIPKNVAERDPTFDFRKWFRQERKRNHREKLEKTNSENVIKIDSQQGLQWLEKSARNGYQQAYIALSHIHMYGYEDVIPSDVQQGLFWLQEAASQNFPTALYSLGKHYLEGVYLEPNLHKGIEYLTRAAELGEPEAQYWLGYAYDAGVCVEENSEKSLHYLNKAAKANHPGACYYLAQMYRLGEKIEKNQVLFLDYLEKAANMKDADALFCIADMYYNGTDGLEKNYRKALKYYKESARNGNANAFVNEAVMYFHGFGTSVDMQRAFYAYQNAISIDPHNVSALYSIASMLDSGTGTTKNSELAQYFLKRAQEAEANSESQ